MQFLKSGDAGLALNKAILSKNNPLADVFYGVDNSFLGRALAADIFEPYDSPALAGIPADLKLDPGNRLLPVDFGYVTLNYDKKYFADNSIPLPQSLADLTKPAYKGLLAVENPATSSPGLSFLLATVAAFGEQGDYTYLDFWRDLRANDVYVADGWEDAYYGQFSGGSGQGDHPLVVSYATSPAAEVYFADPKPAESPTGNIAPPAAASGRSNSPACSKAPRTPTWRGNGSISCLAKHSRPTSRFRCGFIRRAPARRSLRSLRSTPKRRRNLRSSARSRSMPAGMRG